MPAHRRVSLYARTHQLLHNTIDILLLQDFSYNDIELFAMMAELKVTNTVNTSELKQAFFKVFFCLTICNK